MTTQLLFSILQIRFVNYSLKNFFPYNICAFGKKLPQQILSLEIISTETEEPQFDAVKGSPNEVNSFENSRSVGSWRRLYVSVTMLGGEVFFCTQADLIVGFEATTLLKLMLDPPSSEGKTVWFPFSFHSVRYKLTNWQLVPRQFSPNTNFFLCLLRQQGFIQAI